MATPLAVGTTVVVVSPAALDGPAPEGADASLYEPTRSEPTTIVAIQWVTPDGEITEEPQQDFQYVLDAEDPFPDTAVRPELVEVA